MPIYYGTQKVFVAGMDKVYVGSTLVYQKSGTINIDTYISTYAVANNWVNATKYYTVNMDSNITVTATSTGGSSTGTYNSASGQWRIYYSDSGFITISAASGYEIQGYVIYYTSVSSGTFYDQNGYHVENAVPVTCASRTTSVRLNASVGGSCRITQMSVAYIASSTPTKTLDSISLSGTYPTTFYVGDTFSHAGAVVTANYSDSSTANVTNSAIFSNPDMTTAGTKTITVTYTEDGVTKTAQYSITVEQPPSPPSTVIFNKTLTEMGAEQSWTSATYVTYITSDSIISMVPYPASGTCPKYYSVTGGQTWRFYKTNSNSNTFTISATTGYIIKKIKFTFASGYANFLYNYTTVANDTDVIINDTSATFTMDPSGSTQCRITAIYIEYESAP